jgi:hypothetical protein
MLPAAFDSNQPTISEETLKIKQANLTGEVLEALSRGRVASSTVTTQSNYSFIFTKPRKNNIFSIFMQYYDNHAYVISFIRCCG